MTTTEPITERPWRRRHSMLERLVEETGETEPIAVFENDTDAEHALRCVNSHELLLATCKSVESLLCDVWDVVAPLVSGGPDQVNAVADQLRAAIAAADSR